jgi:hypothetical protein
VVLRRRLSVLMAATMMLAMTLASAGMVSVKDGQAKNGNNGNHYGQIKNGGGSGGGGPGRP